MCPHSPTFYLILILLHFRSLLHHFSHLSTLFFTTPYIFLHPSTLFFTTSYISPLFFHHFSHLSSTFFTTSHISPLFSSPLLTSPHSFFTTPYISPLFFHHSLHLLTSLPSFFHHAGHRIQFLVYDPALRRVSVTRLLAKHGSYRAGTGNELTDSYTYEVWIPQVRHRFHLSSSSS
jgi:hypothetical protein